MVGQTKYDKREIYEIVMNAIKKKKYAIYWDLQKATGMARPQAMRHMNKIAEESKLIKRINLKTSKCRIVVLFVLNKTKTIFLEDD